MTITVHGYRPTHPWYYLLGGPILKPRAIKALVLTSGYQGYRADDIRQADRLPEPQRMRKLGQVTDEVKAELRGDLARYRQLAHQLRARRAEQGIPVQPSHCDGLDVALGLKFAHVYNGYAHVVALERLGSFQLSLL